MKQFVYSLDTSGVNSERIIPPSKVNLIIIDSFMSFIKNSSMLHSHFGAGTEFLKLLLKISVKRSLMYCVGTPKMLHSHGMITYGRCKHYSVGSSDAIIGPVLTHEEMRGKGLATDALILATRHINANSKSTRIIIDTREDNYGMQIVIKRAGFIGPIKEFQRKDN